MPTCPFPLPRGPCLLLISHSSFAGKCQKLPPNQRCIFDAFKIQIAEFLQEMNFQLQKNHLQLFWTTVIHRLRGLHGIVVLVYDYFNLNPFGFSSMIILKKVEEKVKEIDLIFFYGKNWTIEDQCPLRKKEELPSLLLHCSCVFQIKRQYLTFAL